MQIQAIIHKAEEGGYWAEPPDEAGRDQRDGFWAKVQIGRLPVPQPHQPA